MRGLLTVLALTASVAGQTTAARVVATASSWAEPIQAPKSIRVIPGHALTNCWGNTSYIGDFSSTNLSCDTDYSAPVTTEGRSPQAVVAAGALNAVSRRRTSYAIVESQNGLYLFSCFERWRWNHCPSFLIGQQLSVSQAGGNVSLLMSGQRLPMTYLASEALEHQHASIARIDSPLAEFTSAADLWIRAQDCDSLSFSACRAQVLTASVYLDKMHESWDVTKVEMRKYISASGAREDCVQATKNAFASLDRYLTIQDGIMGVFQSIDPAAPNAKSAWETGNKRYLQLQDEQSSIDIAAAGNSISSTCQDP